MSLLNQWKAEYFFMYHRSISEKKTNSIAMITSTPEPGNQTLDLQAMLKTSSFLAPAKSCMGQFGLH